MIRLFTMLMPSSEMLLVISRVPAPIKSSPGGTPFEALRPLIVPAVMAARRSGSRPFRGSSATLRTPIVSETLASSVLMAAAVPSTLIVWVTSPTRSVTSFLTTWLMST